MSLCLGLLALAMCPAPAAEPGPVHVGSYSLSEIHIRRTSVQLQLRCQVLSLGEVIEPFDPDLDGTMEAGELEVNEDAIVAYIAEHYRLVAGAEDVAAAGDAARALEVVSSLVVEAPPALDPMNEVSEWIDVVLNYEVDDVAQLATLGVYVDTFYVTSPQHRDSAAVVWNGLELAAWQFAQGAESHVFLPTEEMLVRNAHPVVRYLKVGAARAAGAVDAALLVLLFVLAARRGSRRSGLISAGLFLLFAGAGALAAPLAKLLPQHVRFLELTVPLALGYVGLDDLLHNRGRTRLLETSVFGLALGGREATRLAPELKREATEQIPLLGFALGLAAVLLGLAVVAACLGQDRSPGSSSPHGGEAPEESAAGAFSWRPLRALVDVAAIGVGLWLFWGVFRA